MGLFVALALTGVAAVPVAIETAKELLSAGIHSGWWRLPFVFLPIISAGYFIGLGLAGSIYDVLRPIRHTFVGYLLKCSLCPLAVYGTIGLLMPLLDPKERFAWGSVGGFAVAVLTIGALAGAMLWLIDRVRGNLPRPAR